MRTRGAVEDLVVVDLDDPDEAASRGPAAQRRHFEDHYAELPFGLGTVPRRLDHTPWYSRPGAIAWIALALIGLVALAGGGGGSADDGGRRGAARNVGGGNLASPRSADASPPARSPDVADLTVTTGVRLGLYHVGGWTELDVDRRALRPLPRWALPADLAALSDGADDLGVLPPRPARTPVAYGGRSVCLSTTTGRLTARLAEPGACTPTERSSAELRSRSASSLDGRFLFVSDGADLLVIDAIEGGFVRRVDVALPPFEALFVL